MISIKVSVASYEKQQLIFLQSDDKSFLGADVSINEFKSTRFIFNQTYYVDLYLFFVRGYYFDQKDNRYNFRRYIGLTILRKHLENTHLKPIRN